MEFISQTDMIMLSFIKRQKFKNLKKIKTEKSKKKINKKPLRENRIGWCKCRKATAGSKQNKERAWF